MWFCHLIGANFDIFSPKLANCWERIILLYNPTYTYFLEKLDKFFRLFSGIKPKKNTTKSKPRNKKEDEKELRKEIMELEKTFESLDLDSGSVSTYNNHTSVKKSTFSRGGLFRSSTIDEGSYQSRPNNGPNRRPPPVFGTPAVSKPLKFSWQESSAPAVVDKHTDDWNYQQVKSKKYEFEQ